MTSWSSPEACAARLRGERRPISERLWEKVAVRGPDECWLWQAAVDSGGYGNIDDGTGRLRKAHRIAYALTHGAPGELHVLHRCDTRRCCNPAHLFLGTHDDNMRDRQDKGRTRLPPAHRGEANPAARLDAFDVLAIRTLRALGASIAGLAGAFAISVANARLIVSGRTWKHVASVNHNTPERRERLYPERS
jgi:hypothetical protein